MIDYEKLKAHPLTMAIAKIETNIVACREIQIDLAKILAADLNYSEDILIKAMELASEVMGNKRDD